MGGHGRVGLESRERKICKPSTHKILKNKNEIKSYVLASFISKLTKIKAYYLKCNMG